MGFDLQGESIEIAERLESWQRAGDERLWKIIVSPEFGDRVDLRKLTRDLCQRWRRISELRSNGWRWRTTTRNTHTFTWHCEAWAPKGAHFASAGITSGKASATIAADLCTRQLGYRSEWDAAAAQRREVHNNVTLHLTERSSADGMPTNDGPSTSLTVTDRTRIGVSSTAMRGWRSNI